MPQPGGRQYDYALVEAIRSKSHVVDFEGMPEEIRAIPDDDRECVLDPRVLDMTRKKMSGVIKSGWAGSLLEQRMGLKETHYIQDGEVAKSDYVAEFGDRGIPITVLTPAGGAEVKPVLAFLHGGGFEKGWFGVYDACCTAIASWADCVVVFPEVRLAPEARCPAQLDDCEATIGWIKDNAAMLGVDANRIAIMGDSAGGSLVNGTVQRCRGDIKLAIEAYPAVDIVEVPDWWGYDLYPVVDEQHDEMLNRVNNIKAWIGNTSYSGPDTSCYADPEVSAMYLDDPSFFPRTVVVCSEYDYLRAQDERFAKKLFDAGVDVRLVRYAGMEHGFLELTGVYPQAEDLCMLVVEELRKL